MTDVDRQRITELLALLGEDRLLALGEQLAAALAGLENYPREELGEMLHRLSGSAASLGLPQIAGTLAAAEKGPCDTAQLSRLAGLVLPGLRSVVHQSSRQR